MELMFAEWEDGERFSFEDSDRFEEDSLCSFISEAESLCQNWRGWRKQSAGPNSPTVKIKGKHALHLPLYYLYSHPLITLFVFIPILTFYHLKQPDACCQVTLCSGQHGFSLISLPKVPMMMDPNHLKACLEPEFVVRH